VPTRSFWRPFVLYPLVVAGIALVGVLDFVTGPELAFSIFYLVPVALAASYGPEVGAVLASFSSALVWWLVESSTHAYSHPAIGYWNAAVRLGFFLVVAMMLARIRRQAARDRDLASTDPLTGLANSRAFFEALTREAGRTHRTGRPMTVAYLDLDDFKAVNDGRGHAEGDRVLQSIARAMKQSLRTGDLVARLGGDEFAVLFPETDLESARALLQRLHRGLSGAVASSTVGFSIGAVTTMSPPSAERLMAAADELLYEVKRTGKNAIRVESLVEY